MCHLPDLAGHTYLHSYAMFMITKRPARITMPFPDGDGDGDVLTDIDAETEDQNNNDE